MTIPTEPETCSETHILDRDELVRALEDVAELEHQLMVQYLYAAFSLKKEPDARCSPSQLEHVRRWGSTLYLIARQEMSHLALVSNILAAIGAEPYFGRQNIAPHGLLSPYFQAKNLASKGSPDAGHVPVDLPFSLSPFGLISARRFVCFESPLYGDLPPDRIPTWCFMGHGSGVMCVPRALRSPGVPVANSRLSPSVFAAMTRAAQSTGKLGLLQLLYREVHQALSTIPGLFESHGRSCVEPERDVHVLRVHDRASAHAALALILDTGEGISGWPTFSSHFMRLYDMCEEIEKVVDESPGFQPSLPALDNPTSDLIANPFTRALFELSEHIYVSLLFRLAVLYRCYVPETDDRYPFFSTALARTSFAQLMTNLLRSLGEILVRLDIGDGKHTVGPSFTIGPQAHALLCSSPLAPELGDIDVHLQRSVYIRDRLAELIAGAPEGLPATIHTDLEHVHHSAHRMSASLMQIYRAGALQRPRVLR